MADLVVGETVKGLGRQLLTVSWKVLRIRSMAVKLANMIEDIQPTIKEIQYCGLEMIPHRQLQLSRFSDTLARGRKITEKVLSTRRYNVLRTLRLVNIMKDYEKEISSFLKGPLHTHILADFRHFQSVSESRFEQMELRFCEVDRNLYGINEQLATSEVHFDRMDMNFDRLRRCIRDCCSGLRWFTLFISSGLLLVWFKV